MANIAAISAAQQVLEEGSKERLLADGSTKQEEGNDEPVARRLSQMQPHLRPDFGMALGTGMVNTFLAWACMTGLEVSQPLRTTSTPLTLAHMDTGRGGALRDS